MAKSTYYRKIRVFLSSTFQDMKEERDALVKLFRLLAVEGRKQRISITLLDLRWGITDDQKRNGLVISTCLQEIDNSRPFFIGLIGERYGWVPSKEELGNADLLVKFPRLEYYADQKMSITEMEMRYGVLEADSSFHSLFLQKDGIKPENQNHKALIRDIEASPHTSFFKYHSIDSLVEIVKREFANEMMGNLGVQEEENEHDRIKNIQESIIYRKSENYIDISDYKKG